MAAVAVEAVEAAKVKAATGMVAVRMEAPEKVATEILISASHSAAAAAVEASAPVAMEGSFVVVPEEAVVTPALMFL